MSLELLRSITPGCARALTKARPIAGRMALLAGTAGPVVGKLRRLGVVHPGSLNLTNRGKEMAAHFNKPAGRLAGHGFALQLACHGCDRTLDQQERVDRADQLDQAAGALREHARRKGWTASRALHLCPNCNHLEFAQ